MYSSKIQNVAYLSNAYHLNLLVRNSAGIHLFIYLFQLVCVEFRIFERSTERIIYLFVVVWFFKLESSCIWIGRRLVIWLLGVIRHCCIPGPISISLINIYISG